MTDPSHEKGIDSLSGFFGSLLARSRSLREDMVHETERLRVRIQELESDVAAADLLLAKDWDDIKSERDRLRLEVLKLAAENRDFAQRYVELEDRSTSLANLYAATFQLHSTLDPKAVVQCIAEIAINLIGAAEFIVYLADEVKGDFVVAAREGDLPPRVERIGAPTLPIEKTAMEQGRTTFAAG
ncbi:MAG TPA: diguanylate phosphodiesterase, partial [Thermoanaerobaculia bacterium]|nr:diguanylate phosphodiesterase [Thermoanaerobaculia bacterium]